MEGKKSPPLVGEVLLETKGLKALNSKGLLALKGVSLQLRAGEILGIAGVEGNGQTELVEALTGLRKLEAGEIWIKGNRLKKYNPRGGAAERVRAHPRRQAKEGAGASLHRSLQSCLRKTNTNPLLPERMFKLCPDRYQC
ncbi:ATP-binding cassette domain-containing protein [Candidatus Hakubella thermalkaliphila]|uniref:ATP-binding cassette domain-containing protein n=1 Tax=Candidatus Hakubella thermalkaliphila TaxID=2754717 RepID=UPI0015931015|nr:ATP-binding cassette domain-containing protein [Candidatus Hakubella thermalkaliphila]